jgi:hypothetical protein
LGVRRFAVNPGKGTGDALKPVTGRGDAIDPGSCVCCPVDTVLGIRRLDHNEAGLAKYPNTSGGRTQDALTGRTISTRNAGSVGTEAGNCGRKITIIVVLNEGTAAIAVRATARGGGRATLGVYFTRPTERGKGN